MAKVVAPFLSLQARGTIGGALTASNWKGINTMRIKGNPSNPKTLLQMATRAAFASIGKTSKATDLAGDVVSFVKTKTPAQQSWASFFNREQLGTGLINFNAAKTAYANVANATVKGIFDTAAAETSLEAVDLDGTPNTQISAGLELWVAYAASNRLGDPSAPTTALTAVKADVDAYVEALTGVTIV